MNDHKYLLGPAGYLMTRLVHVGLNDVDEICPKYEDEDPNKISHLARV